MDRFTLTGNLNRAVIKLGPVGSVDFAKLLDY